MQAVFVVALLQVFSLFLLVVPGHAGPHTLTRQEEQALERQVWLKVNQMALDPTAGVDAMLEPVMTLVDLFLEQGRHAKAEPILQMAINQISGKSATINSIPLMRLTARMARIDLAYGRYELASRQFNQLITLNRTKEAFTPAQEQELRLGLARTRVGVALSLADQPARLSRASQLLMVAIPELAQYLGEQHPEVLNTRLQYLILLVRQGYFEQVREESGPLLATYQKLKPLHIPELVQIHQLRGWSLSQGGNGAAGLEAFIAGLSLIPQEYGGDLLPKARLLSSMAVVHIGERHAPEALATFTQLESVIIRQFGRGSFKQARLDYTIGSMLTKHGLVDDGRLWIQKAQDIGHAIFDKDPKLQEKWWLELQEEIKNQGSPDNILELERLLSDVLGHIFTQVENMASWRERLAKWSRSSMAPLSNTLTSLSEKTPIAPAPRNVETVASQSGNTLAIPPPPPRPETSVTPQKQTENPEPAAATAAAPATRTAATWKPAEEKPPDANAYS
ncbi:MAG: hypothetical protein H7833_09885, partial [Magnetococcus sp. DMHC-1]